MLTEKNSSNWTTTIHYSDTYSSTHTQTDRQTDTETDRHTDREIDRPRDRQTDRHRDRQTDRQWLNSVVTTPSSRTMNWRKFTENSWQLNNWERKTLSDITSEDYTTQRTQAAGINQPNHTGPQRQWVRFFLTNLIDLDLHRFVRPVQSSPVKKNAPYHFGIADLRNSGPVPFSGFANQTQWKLNG